MTVTHDELTEHYVRKVCIKCGARVPVAPTQNVCPVCEKISMVLDDGTRPIYTGRLPVAFASHKRKAADAAA